MNKILALLFLTICALAGNNLFADTVRLKDGSQFIGMATGNAREIIIKAPGGDRKIAIEQVQSIRFGRIDTAPAAAPLPAPAPPPPVSGAPAAAGPNFTLPAGTRITIRTIDAIDSKASDLVKEYAASLDEPVLVSNLTVIPAKSNAVLRIVEIRQAGKLKGSTTLSLRLIAVNVNGQKVGLETDDVVSESDGKGKTTIRDAAIGTVAGCAAGAAVAGVVGCEVGSAVGGTVGIVASVLGGKTVKIPAETRITFKLSKPALVPSGTPSITDVSSNSTNILVADAIRRGEQYANNGEFVDALKEYRKALDMNRRSSLAHYNVAMVFFQQRNYQAAANEFREVLRGDLEPGWTEVWTHIYLGNIFDITGQRERAVNEYTQAQRTRDNTLGAQDQIGKYLHNAYRENVSGDSLTLLNGSLLRGNWLSADSGEVQFLIDDKPQTYAKDDVVAVVFGSSAAVPVAMAVAPAVTVPVVSAPPAAVRVQNPQVAYGPEPEWVGAVYFRDASGSFIPLERNATMSVQSRYPVPYTYNLNFFVVQGPRSPVRLKETEKMVFVVRLANGIDPRIFNLYPMNANKKARGATIDKKTNTYKDLLVDITRVGVSSYGLTSESALATGEYCFIPRNSTDAYCFGVDAH